MKSKLLLFLLAGLSLNLKAQSIKDSVAKYEEITRLYLYSDNFKAWDRFSDQYVYWKAKQDSIERSIKAIEDKKRFLVQKKALEQKYKIKLP